jgi:hypothetical protein
LQLTNQLKSYAAGSPERKELQAMLKELRSKELDIPMYIGSAKKYAAILKSALLLLTIINTL